MDRRRNHEMRKAVDHAMAMMTPECHKEAVTFMTRAKIPVNVVSRVIFLPHRTRSRQSRGILWLGLKFHPIKPLQNPLRSKALSFYLFLREFFRRQRPP